MKKVAGLSVLCFLFFGNVHADQDEGKNEYSVKSWSINMEQRGNEPIQVQTERKESNKNGVVLHEKTSGIIDKNGRFIKNEEKPRPRVKPRKPWRLWNPFSRDEEAVEEIRAPEHWREHAKKHPGLPPCDQAPNVEAPKYPESHTTAYPENKNCWKRIQPRNQAPVCNEDEDSRPARFDRRRHRNRIDLCNEAPNPRHVIVHSCEFGDNEDNRQEERPVTLPRRVGVCPLKQQQRPVPSRRNYRESRFQNVDQQQRPVPSPRNYQEPRCPDTNPQPVEKVAAPRVIDPWGFSDDFFKTWQEFERQFNEFYR